MKRRLLGPIGKVLCILLLGCSGVVSGEQFGPLDTAEVLWEMVGIVQFRSQQGFTFAVPQGMVARLIESKVYITEENFPAGPADFVIQTCSGPDPALCLGDPQMPARLVKVENTVLAGRPATEYTFWRRKKEHEWTLEWAEVHTALTAKGTTFDVVAKIPPYLPPERWDVYDQIRRSFRLTEP